MKRRLFLQFFGTALTLPGLPGLPMPTAAKASPVVTTVPAQARSWAIYMSTLHGECTPQALQTMVNISASEARNTLTQLVAEGVIKANPLLQKSVANLTRVEKGDWFQRLKSRLDLKTHQTSRLRADDEVEMIELDAEVSANAALLEQDGDVPELANKKPTSADGNTALKTPETESPMQL